MKVGSTSAILERKEELAGLTALAQEAIAGSGSLVIVEGPAGIGKTRLLAAAQTKARELGMSILSARGSEVEREFGFGIVRQLFEDRVRSVSAGQRRVMLAGAARAASTLLAGQPTDTAAAQDKFAVIHGLYWLCSNLAALRPVMLLVDDAHLADEPSLRWLHFLGGRIEELPVLAVVAARTDEPRIEAPMLAEILIDPRHHHVPLSALSEVGVTRLVRDRLREDADIEFCRACHAASGGNPFYLNELLAGLEAQHVRPVAESVAQLPRQGPESVADAVLHRLTRLSSGAPSLARAVAVLGRDADLQMAGQLAGLERTAAAQAADALVAMQILQPSGTLDFVHPIVRSAIYAEIPHWERAGLHRRAAALLDGAGRLEAVAGQLLKSEPAAEVWTVQVLRNGAQEAVSRGAPEGAVAYLRRALAEPPPTDQRPEVLREAGQAAFLNGDPVGITHLRSALQLARESAQRANIALDLSRALVVADQLAEAVDILRRGIDDAKGDRELGMALEAQLLGVAGMWASATQLGRAHFERWIETDLPDSPGGRLLLANLAAWRVTVGGLPSTGVRDLAVRALSGGHLLAEASGVAQAFYLATNSLTVAEWLELGQTWLDRAVEQAQRSGSLVAFALATCYRSDAAYRAGRLGDAEADAFASLRAIGTNGWWGHAPVVTGYMLQALIERGHLDAAEALVRDHPTEVGDSDTMFQMLGRHLRGRLRLAQGRLHDGLRDVLASGEWQRRTGWRNPSLWPWRSDAALCLARLGRLDEARTLAWEEVQLARPLGQRRTLGMSLRAAGLVEEGERGLELLEEAVEVLENGPSPLEHARALVDLGRAYRHRGHRINARQVLTEGLDLAHRCGATVLVGSAQDELRMAGARPRRLRTTGLMALTAAERQVAKMAAEGLSNPEIAQTQFVSLKTVETHLSRVYSKLGITSRAALPTALARPVDKGPG